MSTSEPNSGASTPAAGRSLPPRPPPSQKPAFAFKPRNVAATSKSTPLGPTAQSYGQAPGGNETYMNAEAYQGGYGQAGFSQGYAAQGFGLQAQAAPGHGQQGYAAIAYGPQGYGSQTHGQQGYGPQGHHGAGYDHSQHAQPHVPAIKNPFAPPLTLGEGYSNPEAELKQQMAQWQSNYGNPSTKNDTPKSSLDANSLPLKFNRLEGSVPPDPGATVIRKGGGMKWEDPTLLEWGNHHRLFIGNLAGEVTDESLLKAFAKYPSVQKARVIRDKRTTKSKGFGFVSFSDADEYFQAAKDMQGKYIGSHPVLIRKAETEIKPTTKKLDHGKNYKNNKKQRDKQTAEAAGGYDGGSTETKDKTDKTAKKDVLGAQSGQGVQKKTKPKYKLLG